MKVTMHRVEWGRYQVTATLQGRQEILGEVARSREQWSCRRHGQYVEKERFRTRKEAVENLVKLWEEEADVV